ncbi:hypothetical protein BaRGS_00022121, partial [Batillaria attramentaria]
MPAFSAREIDLGGGGFGGSAPPPGLAASFSGSAPSLGFGSAAISASTSSTSVPETSFAGGFGQEFPQRRVMPARGASPSAASVTLLEEEKREGPMKTGRALDHPPQMLTSIRERRRKKKMTSPVSWRKEGPAHMPATSPARQVVDKYYPPDFTMADMLQEEAEEPLLGAPFRRRKKKEKLALSGGPEGHHFKSVRWESPEAFRARTMALDSLAAGEAMDAGGGGVKADFRSGLGQVPMVREGANLDVWQQMWSGNEEELMSLQTQLVSSCYKLLESGLSVSTLGTFRRATAASELEELLATVLVLLALWMNWTGGKIHDQISYLKDVMAFKSADTMGKFVPIFVSFLRNGQVEKAVQFCRDMDARHPMACSSMELAPDWLSLGARLFGLV